jgi:hypothetical protein
MKVRIARHTDRLDEVVAFYRDLIGLRQTGEFQGHDGYDGAFLEMPLQHHAEESSPGRRRVPVDAPRNANG